MPRKRGRARLTQAVLASELSDLLHLKRGDHGECPTGKAIVQTILRTMTEALQRGESVYVRGLGKFEVRPGCRKILKPVVRRQPKPSYSPVFVEYMAPKRVMFTPDYQLRKRVNLC